MYPIEGKFYSAYLREKAGELRALRLLDSVSAGCLLPILVALPLSERENRGLSTVEAVKREVGRVTANWGDRVCLWDPRFLVFNPDDIGADAQILEHVLEQFAVFRARVIPVVGLRENYHRASVMSAHAARVGSGLAIRIEYGDIQEYELISAQLEILRCRPADCILVVDISDADIAEHDEFAQSLVGWLYELRARAGWAKIILTAGTYPSKNPAPPEGETTTARHEWKLWQWLLNLDPGLAEFVMFGDFGADSPQFNFSTGGRPIPHLRYLINLEWFVARGNKDYGSIRGVTKTITASKTFKGRDFSAGDEYIFDCAKGVVGTSDPTHWRAVNMNHHLTTTIHALALLYGVELSPRRASAPEQPSLFDGLTVELVE